MGTNNGINNKTMLHVEVLMIIEPGGNVTLMIEDINSNNKNLWSALASMDVALTDRKYLLLIESNSMLQCTLIFFE